MFRVKRRIENLSSSLLRLATFTQPVTSTLATSSTSSIQPSKNYVLYTCDSFSDGVGDTQHLIDFVRHHQENPEFSKYQPLIIIGCPENKKTEILTILEENEFVFNSKSIPSNIHLICHTDHRLRPENFTQYLMKFKSLEYQLRRTKCMLNISTDCMSIHEGVRAKGWSGADASGKALSDFLQTNDIQFPCLTILDHSGDENKPNSITMGAGKNRGGFKLINHPKIKDKANVLLDINDLAYLNVLLDKHIFSPATESKISSDECRNFLNTSLLIPCYFQEGPENFSRLITGVLHSSLVNDYKEVVFHTNHGQIFIAKDKDDEIVKNEKGIPVVDAQKYKTCMSNKISNITIIRKIPPFIHRDIIENDTCVDTGQTIKVRIIEGFRLTLKDYNCMLQSAQLFHGCSGDNSLEHALSLGMIPLYQVRSWKQYFISGFINYLDSSHSEKRLVKKFFQILLDNYNRLYQSELISLELAEVLTVEFKAEWDRLVKHLHENDNIYSRMTDIAKKLLVESELMNAPKKHHTSLSI